MKKYAVSHIDWYNHELETKIVSADTPEAALTEAFPDVANFVLPACDNALGDMKFAKQIAFDGDCMFNIVEIV